MLPSPAIAARRLARDTRGLTTVEYIILLCLLACVAIGAWRMFGDTVVEKVAGADGTIRTLPTLPSAELPSTSSGSAGALATAPTGPTPPGGPSSVGSTRGASTGSAPTFWSVAGAFGSGAWSQGRDTVEGLGDVAGAVWHVATHPGETASAIYDAATHPAETWGRVRDGTVAAAGAAADAAGRAWETLRDGTAEERAELLGRGAFELAAALIPGSTLTKTGRVGRVARAGSEAIDVASDVGRRADDAAAAAGAVRRARDRFRGRDELFEGTSIPKGGTFALPNGEEVFITPNALEHIAEMGRGARPWNAEIARQAEMDSLLDAVSRAGRDGVPRPGEPIHVGGWELVFGEPRQPGHLPSVIHANPERWRTPPINPSSPRPSPAPGP